jgi:hypothetical protein
MGTHINLTKPEWRQEKPAVGYPSGYVEAEICSRSEAEVRG